MIDALFIGGADDTNDRHHLTNTGKNQTSLTPKMLPIAHSIQEREAVSVFVSLHFLVFQVRDKERVWPPAGTFVLGQPRHKLSVRGLLQGPGASLLMVNKNSLMKSNV